MFSNSSIWDDIKYEFRKGDMIIQLIFVNIAVFLFLGLTSLIVGLFIGREDLAATIARQFTLPADLSQLITRPWTIITHMFAHAGLFHILFNMLWLYWLGRILQEYIGQRKILPLYVLGALAGAALYVLAYNVIPAFQGSVHIAEALGASAGVMAIIVGTATLLPDFRINLLLIGPVKLKWLALVAIILDILAINGANAGGSIAHLGGALFGYLYIRQLQSGNDWSRGFNLLMDYLVSLFQSKKGPRVHYRNTGQKKKRSYSYSTTGKGTKQQNQQQQQTNKEARQQKLDEILDKISESGYDGLTKEEKEFLFKMSNDK